MALDWHYKYQDYRIGPFYNGLAAIFYEKVGEEWIDGSYGESGIKKVSYVEIQKIVCYIDKEGMEIFPRGKYDTIGKYCEGFISIELKGKWGFVNTLGMEVVPPKYDEVGDFFKGFAQVWLKQDELYQHRRKSVFKKNKAHLSIEQPRFTLIACLIPLIA